MSPFHFHIFLSIYLSAHLSIQGLVCILQNKTVRPIRESQGTMSHIVKVRVTVMEAFASLRAEDRFDATRTRLSLSRAAQLRAACLSNNTKYFTRSANISQVMEALLTTYASLAYSSQGHHAAAAAITEVALRALLQNRACASYLYVLVDTLYIIVCTQLRADHRDNAYLALALLADFCEVFVEAGPLLRCAQSLAAHYSSSSSSSSSSGATPTSSTGSGAGSVGGPSASVGLSAPANASPTLLGDPSSLPQHSQPQPPQSHPYPAQQAPHLSSPLPPPIQQQQHSEALPYQVESPAVEPGPANNALHTDGISHTSAGGSGGAALLGGVEELGLAAGRGSVGGSGGITSLSNLANVVTLTSAVNTPRGPATELFDGGVLSDEPFDFGGTMTWPSFALL
jgi:uncharacterized membrane protein YgcG